MNKLLSLLFLLVFFNGFSQKFSSMEVIVDSSGFGQNNVLRLTIILTKRNGKEMRIEADDAKSKWKKVNISGNDMLTGVDRGYVSFAQNKAHASNRVLTLRVATDDNAVKLEKSILLPYVTQLFVQNNELIVNETQQFNYTMLFSNGKMSNPAPELFSLGNVISDNREITLNANSEFRYLVSEPTTEQFKDWKLIDRRNGQTLSEKRMNIRYPVLYVFERNGVNGFEGFNGRVSSGYSAAGQNGSAGGNASSAPDLDVYIKQGIYGPDTIITFHVFSKISINEVHFVKYTRNPAYVISAMGGTGGSGGSGSDGQPGKIDTTNKVNSPDGGSGGNGGNGGIGGNGGRITLHFSPETSYLRPAIIAKVDAGNGGSAGTGGKGGKGDSSNSKLLGKVLKLRDGIAGNPGLAGQGGRPGEIQEIHSATREEWQIQYNARVLNGN